MGYSDEAKLKEKLEKAFDKLIEAGLLPKEALQQKEAIINQMVNDFKNQPEVEQEHLLKNDKVLAIALIAYTTLNANPNSPLAQHLKQHKTNVLTLLLNPQNELTPDNKNRQGLTKLKMEILALIDKAENDQRISPELAKELRQELQNASQELENSLKNDPGSEPLAENEALQKLLLTYEQLTKLAYTGAVSELGMTASEVKPLRDDNLGLGDSSPGTKNDPIGIFLEVVEEIIREETYKSPFDFSKGPMPPK